MNTCEVSRDGSRASGVPTREAILEAALVTFTEHTYGGTAMAEVADRAEVAVGSIYRHFPSKEALGSAVFVRWKGRLLEHLRQGVDDTAPVRVAFGQLWRVLTDFATDRPEAFAFLEHQQHEAYVDPTGRAVSDQVTALAADLVRRGQRSGEIRSGDPAVLIALAYGAFVGLDKALPPGLDRPARRRALAGAEEMVWDMIRAT